MDRFAKKTEQFWIIKVHEEKESSSAIALGPTRHLNVPNSWEIDSLTNAIFQCIKYKS